MKPLRFEGDTLEVLRTFPPTVQQDAGYQLHRVQCGGQPKDYKPMPSIGAGVEELRIRASSGAYRFIYITRLADAVHVLHVFKKKTERTAQADIDLAKLRLAHVLQNKRVTS
jgi:phage-related protein